jgi:hypothetical protein
MSGGPYFLGGCNPNLPQLTQWDFDVGSTSGACSDFTNAINWLNSQSAPPWSVSYTGNFDTPASLTPDSEGSETIASPAGTVDYFSQWNLTGPILIKASVLCLNPTLYVVGSWFDPGTLNFRPQATCILSGIINPCGNGIPSYAYNLPLPSLDGCNPTNGYAISYQLWDAAGWAEFEANCSEDGECTDLLDPGPCAPLTGDPFNDDDP